MKINLKSKQKSFFCVCRNWNKKNYRRPWTGDGPAPGGQKAREKFADGRPEEKLHEHGNRVS